jgi:hypothetical protein
VRIFDLSKGDVLEMGTGFFSTMYLHHLAAITDRKVVSYESAEHWYNRARRYQSEYHEVIKVQLWDDANVIDRHWGMVLIDYSPQGSRIKGMERVKDNADFVVVHDTEPRSERIYGYSKVAGLYKYRYDYKKIDPWTSVFSNFIDVTQLAVVDELTKRLLKK